MVSMPLDGILIADFSRVLAGPYAATTLADLGARVIKVERAGSGDDTRTWGPPWTPNSAAYFESANRNKESVTFDLRDPHDQELAHTLALQADVVIENFRSGSLSQYGLAYEQLQPQHPELIYCSITGFGSGAGADMAGYDFLVQAVGGLMSITGEPAHTGGQPMKVGVALVDVLAAKDATIGILAALLERERSGSGQRIEVNLLSSLLAALVNQASSFLATGDAPHRIGNAHPSIAPYELLRCKDATIAVACGNDQQFRRLAAALALTPLADDPMFANNPARVQHREALVASLERVLRNHSADYWVATLHKVGVPAGVVGSVADGFALAERLGLAPRVPVGNGSPDQVRHPVTYAKTPVTRYEAPPQIGSHNELIRNWLQQENTQ